MLLSGMSRSLSNSKRMFFEEIRLWLLYLLTFYVLAERKEYTKDTFASASREFCAPGRSYVGYSVFPGVTLMSPMYSPESLFPDMQQLSLALDLNTT